MRQTDYQRFIRLFQDCGIEYDLTADPDMRTAEDCKKTIVCRAKEHIRVEGYEGFFVVYEFDRFGKFIRQAVWE